MSDAWILAEIIWIVAANTLLRLRRITLGFTQAQLASAAGVSRQLVVAAEAGVNTPSVDAALRLAQALECSAQELFGPPAVRAPRITVSDRTHQRVRLGCLVVAGCDPALQIAEAMLADAGPGTLLALDATTGMAMSALRDGGVHAAVAHGRAGSLPRPPVAAIRVHLACWQVGLGIAPAIAASAGTLEACLEQHVPIVQRQESAAAQQALRRATSALGRELPPATVTSGHLDAARAAAALGCAAITTEAAARLAGLMFMALESHTVEISVDQRWRNHPGVESLGNLLTSRAFSAEVGRMGGYDLRGCGALVGTIEGDLG
jgi:transcriptional regulator with XRE-family HTH domain